MAANEQILQAIRQRRANYRPGKFRKKLKKPKRWLWPASVAREYTRALWGIVEEMNEAIELDLLPHLPELADLAASTRPDSFRADDVIDWAEKVAELLIRARTAFEKKRKDDPERLARIFAEQASSWNDKEFKAVVKSALGVDPFVREPWLKAELNGFVRQNVALIKSLPDQHFKDIEGITLRGLQAGRRHEAIAKEIRERFQAPRNRADLIARDQISKLDGQLTKLRQQELGINCYTWRTSRDERVRARHREREGMVYSWDDPPPGGHPQEEIRCRCKAEPVFEDLLGPQ